MDDEEGHPMVAMRGIGRPQKPTLLSSVGLCHFVTLGSVTYSYSYCYSGGSEADNRPVAQEDSSHDPGHRERGPGRGTDKNPPPAQEGDMAVSYSFFRPLDSCRYQAPLELLPEG